MWLHREFGHAAQGFSLVQTLIFGILKRGGPHAWQEAHGTVYLEHCPGRRDEYGRLREGLYVFPDSGRHTAPHNRRD